MSVMHSGHTSFYSLATLWQAFRKPLTEYKGSPLLSPEWHPYLRQDPTLVYYAVGILQEELEAYAEKNDFS